VDLAEQTEDFSLAEAQLLRIAQLPPPFNGDIVFRRDGVRRKANQRRRMKLLLRAAGVLIAFLCAGIVGLLFVTVQQNAKVEVETAARQNAEKLHAAETDARMKAEKLQAAEAVAKTTAQELAGERERVNKAQPWLTLAALAAEEKFHQGAALYYA